MHVVVCVIGDKLNSAGVLADFVDIKKAVCIVFDDYLVHKYLIDFVIFELLHPTSERIAVYIAKSVQALLDKSLDGDIKVSKVMAWESDDACATYFP